MELFNFGELMKIRLTAKLKPPPNKPRTYVV